MNRFNIAVVWQYSEKEHQNRSKRGKHWLAFRLVATAKSNSAWKLLGYIHPIEKAYSFQIQIFTQHRRFKIKNTDREDNYC